MMRYWFVHAIKSRFVFLAAPDDIRRIDYIRALPPDTVEKLLREMGYSPHTITRTDATWILFFAMTEIKADTLGLYQMFFLDPQPVQ